MSLEEAAYRQRALDHARRALRTGDLETMRAALELLPTGGQKALQLRSKLIAAINGRPTDDGRTPAAARRPSLDGPRYVIELVDDGPESGLFRVIPRAADVIVEMNRRHPAFAVLASDAGRLSEGVVAAITAWAMLEVEAGSGRRRERVVEMRSDWSRLLRRLSDAEGE